MAISEKINCRVSELIDKYSNPSNSVEQLLCDQYPSNKLAYKIIDENMEEYALSYGELKTQSTLMACGLRKSCLLYTSPSPRDATLSRMPSSA